MKIKYEDLKQEFYRVLIKRNVESTLALECAQEFADTTAYGVLSHGINRFPIFISQMDKGEVKPLVNPVCEQKLGSLEVWNGNLGIGNITAKRMMQRAIELASTNNIGIVALNNTNHWMRGGSYGYQAAKQGYIGICFTNSLGVMPAWGTKECCIGTNPLILGVPSNPITLVDFSMSMFSYGKLQTYRLQGKTLPLDGGFDDEGNLTRDPSIIEKNKQILPTGFWKGSALSIVLDMIAVALSGGKSVRKITEQGSEFAVSQIFIALKPTLDKDKLQEELHSICDYILTKEPRKAGDSVHIPGHLLEQKYKKSLEDGIEVNADILESIKKL